MRAPLPSLVARAACVLALAMLMAAGPVAAHPESAAPSLRPDVLRAGHEPAVVQPHTQWRGFLELDGSTKVTAAYYQVCRVGQACFAPPTPATMAERDAAKPVAEQRVHFSFETADYLANGRPVDYEAGWRIGVTWILEERLANGTTQLVRFPMGPDVLSPDCQGDAALPCAEAHYLAFDIPDEGRDSPSLPVAALLGILVVFAMARRQNRDSTK